VGDTLRRYWASGWGFDWLYDRIVVKPFVALARANKSDIVDRLYVLTAALTRGVHHVAVLTQTGRLRWYAANMALGIVVVLLVVLEVL
jgi:NADH-quinone oxidoreductase subunit L